MDPGFILHDNCDGEPFPAELYCYKRSMTFAFLVSLCASVSICGTHWVQILEYSSSPIIAITVHILVDRADHNSSVVTWLLPHISLLTWQMWVTTPYHSQPISLCHFLLLHLHISLCHFSIKVWCCHLLSKILVMEYDWKCSRYSLLFPSSFL